MPEEQIKYGTQDYYENIFSDILADIIPDDPAITENIIYGFFDALESWRIFHANTASEYQKAISLAEAIKSKLD